MWVSNMVISSWTCSRRTGGQHTPLTDANESRHTTGHTDDGFRRLTSKIALFKSQKDARCLWLCMMFSPLRDVEAERWKISFSVWRLSEAAAWTQTTFFSSQLLHRVEKGKKSLKKKKSTAWTSSVLCRLCRSPPPPPAHHCWSTRDWKTIVRIYQAGKQYPSEDTGGNTKSSSDVLHQENPDTEETCFWLFCLVLLCGKCCSTLPTLPGAHPVCEI